MVSNENIESYKRTAEMFELVIEKYPENKKNKVYKAKLDMLKMFLKDLGEKVTIDDVTHYPDYLEPVLAEIEHINDLGKSKYYEVVYYDGEWCSYSERKTFEDGEKVVNWGYCKYFI
ncbi:MAG: hypothetical protein ACJA1B_001399 [Polaribacter sp.]|jgi:hypothetical protein